MNSSDFVSRRLRTCIFPFVLFAVLLPAISRGQVVINEIMADNNAVAPLPAYPDYFPDYVELHNTTGSAIDLGAEQWSLSNKKEPRIEDADDFFRFAPGVVIPANGRLLVFFDDRTEIPGVHTVFTANGQKVIFTLSSSSDRVQLYKTVNSLVDSNIFGMQVPNIALGRVPDVTGDFTLVQPSPCSGAGCQTNRPVAFLPAPSAGGPLGLKINEWLVLGNDGTNIARDWFEIYNPDSNNIVQLSGLIFADAGNFDEVPILPVVAPLSFIAPNGHVQIFCLSGDQGNPDDADEVDFGLSSSSGDSLYIIAPDRTTIIDSVQFGAFTTPDVTRGRLPDGTDNILFEGLPNASPRAANFATITEVVINEVLAHTDPPFEDAIELHNTTTTNVNIGHWWLTNDRDVPKKFRIPADTIVPPGGFVVFYEGRNTGFGFNRSGTDISPNFTLNSARGDEVYLFKGRPDGTLTGDRVGVDFGPSPNGVSFGRYVTSAENDNDTDFVAMVQRTFGQDNPSTVAQFRTGTGKTNSAPRVGPVVITEVQYDIGTVDEEFYEFLEIRNISDEVVPLYDPAFPTNRWRLKDGVDFTFPANQSLQPDEYALIVNFNPVTDAATSNAFRIAYPNIPADVKFYGPYGGSLNNNGDRVELAVPDAPQGPNRPDAGLVPYYVIDRVDYNNNAPWPEVENTGSSLQRRVESDYGNDPVNWKGFSLAATPGRFNSTGMEPPRITGQPQDLTVKEHLNASFTVRVRGGERTFQWTFNGNNIEGGTNATLEIVGVTLDDAGPYQVIASNEGGSVTSIVANLTVTAGPPDTTKPAIAITSPANNARLTSPTVTLRGTASDNTALDRIEYQMAGGSFLTATGRTVWGSEITLEPGTNTIIARAIDTSGNSTTSKVHRLIYVVTSPLTLSTTGNGTVTGAANGQQLEVGRNYTLTATPASGFVFSNWTGDVSGNSSKLTFTMQPELSVVANFVPNPFPDVDGKYAGLFYNEEDFEHGSSGYFSLTVTERGSYTASLTVGGRKHSASGQLNLEGHGTNSITRKGTNALIVQWAVALDGSDEVTGSVSDGVWTSTLEGDRAVFSSRTNPNTNVAKHTFVIPGTPGATSSPEGDGYGTASIDANGMVTIKGFLADKTTFSQKVAISKNGEWPLFASLYAGKGSILGWTALTNDTGDFHGSLLWSKPASTTARHYQAGFSEPHVIVGSRYVAPTSGTRILNLPTGEVILTGGNLLQAQTNQVSIGTNNKVTNNTPAQKLVWTFVTPSGLFKGNFTPPGATRSVPIAGAVLQSANQASGYFLGTNQSGRVLLQATP